MLAACLLLVIAVLGGTLLTYVFDPAAPRAARLCTGACLGMALMAGVGFLFALWIGLNSAGVAVSALVLLLPLLLLIKSRFRAQVVAQFWFSAAKPKRQLSQQQRSRVGYWLFYLAITLLLGLVFSRAVYARPDGIYTGFPNNLGDLPLHMQVTNSFVHGQNIPPEDPTYAGARFAYPFMVDFMTAMLVRAGAGIISAMWLQNMLLALALVGLLHYWTLLLTRNRTAGLIAPLLVLFSGGLGWWLLFSDYGASDGFFSLLGNLPHDYTILPEPDSLLRWGNSLTTLFVPQRSILFGIPLAILIFCQWWSAISAREPSPMNELAAGTRDRRSAKISVTFRAGPPAAAPVRPRMLAAGVCAGLLPLIHAHTFLALMAVAACLAILFRSAWRGWIVFFATAIALSLPELLWLAHAGAVNAHSFLGWQPGWDHGTHNVLWFWFVNAGPFLLTLLAALLWRSGDLGLSPQVVKFYLPFIFCFLVPNLIKLAPWVWDNIKVLFLWYIASVPLVAFFLARWWAQRSRWRWLAPLVFASMVLAGSLDVWRVITGTTELREFDTQAIAMARSISEQTAPRALILHAPTFNSPVFLTGRRSLLGYPGWMWSRGLDYSQRNLDIERIYSGGPESGALLQQYGIDYVLVGPDELSQLRTNEGFLSQYRKVARAGPYRLYKIDH
ncbi:MAG TPA: hypothetical protein VFR84_12920 [Candidatus Angelobacter sp.]|nr:hypothetical protein [Candidatus Angelobacter sp.]